MHTYANILKHRLLHSQGMIYGIIILMITQTIPFKQRISKDIMQFKKGFKKGLLLKKKN